MKHIEVVAGIIEYNGRVLCMLRDNGKYAYTSLKWEFPGGKIEEGETKEQALKRELMEEMEFDVEIEKPFLDIYHKYPDFDMNMYCFVCRAKSDKFVMNVHRGFAWLDIECLNSLDWAEADKPAVQKLLKEGL